MSYELYLRLYDRAGDLKKGFIDPIWARYADSVNDDAPLVFMLHAENEAVALLEELDLVEVMIRNRELDLTEASGGFISAFVGVIRDLDRATEANGETFITYTAPAVNHILSFRSVLWYAGVTNRSTFADVRAETIMKTLVTYNATASASIANGRLRNGDLLPSMGYDLSVAADLGAGALLSATFKGGNLLASLQKLAEQGAGDFALTWQGANDYEFEFYPGQLGRDLTSGAERVLFSLENNTMLAPRLLTSGARATVALAAGQGQEDLRATDEVFGPDYLSAYDLELFVDARNESTSAGRVYRGGLKLDQKRKNKRLTFDVLQTSNQFYSPIEISGRKTYRAGDLVLARYPTDEARKIETVQVYWKHPSAEEAFTVDITTREVIFENGS